MFSFFKNKKSTLPVAAKDTDQNDENQKVDSSAASGVVAAASAQNSISQASSTFAKPATYTGNRNLYDSGKAKMQAKKDAFAKGTVKDRYTGEKLLERKIDAKWEFGNNWADHLAESDHVVSIEKTFDMAKNNPWITNEDIKRIVNDQDNIEVVSRRFNNAKRSRSNTELVNDEAYQEKVGLKILEEEKASAIRNDRIKTRRVKRKIAEATVKNAAETGHKAGMDGGTNAGITAVTMSGIMNLVSVIKGEKDTSEALADTVADGGQAFVTGYAFSGGLTVVSHSLTASSSKFIQALSESNVPGQVITAVMVTGNTLKRYGNGEISTQECILELGEKGLNLATTGYAMAVGQSLIPVPIVGAAVGALAGNILTSKYYHELIDRLQTKQMEHEERQRIIRECKIAAQQAREYRAELETYLAEYFKDYQDCFDEALYEIRNAFQMGDADGVISGANQITRKLGGNVYYENVEGFKDFLENNSVDVL